MTNEIAISLLNAAQKAAENAYAPYSNFNVGAAVLLENGDIVCGCNVENASYGLTICAERVAIGNAICKDKNAKITAIAIVSPNSDKMLTPCGACRQVISEFATNDNVDIEVVMVENNEPKVKTISELLPESFSF